MTYHNYHLLSEKETTLEDRYSSGEISYSTYSYSLSLLHKTFYTKETAAQNEAQFLLDDEDTELSYSEYIDNTSKAYYEVEKELTD